MSKNKQEQQEASSLEIPETTPETEITAGTETEQNQAKPSPEPPPQVEVKTPVIPVKLTVSQYLCKSPKAGSISALIVSLYKTRVMSFEEWESVVNALLKRQTR